MAWHGAQGRTVLCLQVHACKAAGKDDGSQQHTAGNRRPGGSTGQGQGGSASCCLGAQEGEEREGPRAGGGLARCAKKKQQGCAYTGDGEFLTCAPREESGLGRRGSDCEEKKKKRETGWTADLGRKSFSYFSFCKKIQTNLI